jgi:C-terminal processing protease CtpA/Prc
LALCNRNERAYFVDYEVAVDNVYYIQYNKCISREKPPYGFKGELKKLPSFQEFQEKILKTATKRSFDKIIVDLRFNTGGNSSQGTELIEKMAEIKKINERGKLYVILGRFTFSSAIINAMDFSNKTQAIFVGEETSGKPNHYGEVRSFTLPNSGLNINYSTKYFKRSEKNLKTITPDHIIETSFKDFKEGKDPVYDWIIKQ